MDNFVFSGRLESSQEEGEVFVAYNGKLACSRPPRVEWLLLCPLLAVVIGLQLSWSCLLPSTDGEVGQDEPLTRETFSCITNIVVLLITVLLIAV